MLNFLFPWWVWWVRQLHELASAFENKWHIWKWNLIWSLNCNECFKSWSSENLSSPSSSCSVTNLQLKLGSLIDHVLLTASCESVSEHTKRIIRILQGLLDISVSSKHVSTIFLVSAYIVRRPIVGRVWLQSFVVSKLKSSTNLEVQVQQQQHIWWGMRELTMVLRVSYRLPVT